MRILTLCYEYPPVGGGGGRVARMVAEGLAGRGHEVRVQTAALGFRSRRTMEHGVEVFRTASGRRRAESCTVPEMGLYLAMSLWAAWRLCRAWRPEMIHAHFALPTGALAWVLHRMTGIPYVLTTHLGDVPGGVPDQTDRLFRWIGPVARRIWREASAVTAVSSFVQELGERAYSRPVRRIVNGISLEGRPPLESLSVGRPPRLLFVGRLNAQKNVPLLIEALARVTDLPWRFTLIGDGPEAPRVQARLHALQLEERVLISGWLDSVEVTRAMEEADVLCLPSSSEGMPVAGIEALRCGLALATSDIPGVRDLVSRGENGVTAPAGDVEGYARSLRQLLADPVRLLALRQASWRKAAQFNLHDILAEYEEALLHAATAAAESS